jgi:hypothetical protein
VIISRLMMSVFQTSTQKIQYLDKVIGTKVSVVSALHHLRESIQLMSVQ